jgi:hypothetical protein
LPPIESITAQTDISGFLAPGVPIELTRAALRRAWSADPRIRDFIGPSENSWDFNAPDAMGGFGPLEMTDELRRQLLQMVGLGAPDEGDPAGKTGSQMPVEAPVEQSMPTLAEAPAGEELKSEQVAHPRIEPTTDTDSCAGQENEDGGRPMPTRSHGGALPQ